MTDGTEERFRPDDALVRLRAVSGRERAEGQTVWVLNADVIAALDYIAQLEADDA